MDTLLKNILRGLKPSEQDQKHLESFIREISRIAKTLGYDPVIVGSTGKDTWMKGDHDIDLFLMFPKDLSREQLEENGLEAGKRIMKELKGKYRIKYAEHPYVHGETRDYKLDIVPCYRIKKDDNIVSAVDRSPLHLEYILENLDESLKDDVRLLKQFFRSAGVYGSDVKTEGFSGYVCELLIIKYRGFKNTIKAISKWKVPTIIDIENQWNGKVPRNMFKNQPLILIDPTDKRRNTGAIITPANFVKVVERAKEFLKKPSDHFFKTEPAKPLTRRDINHLKKRKTKFLMLQFKRPKKLVDDDVYPQVRRLLHRLKTMFEYNGFSVLYSIKSVNSNISLLFEFEVWQLPVVEKIVGPPVSAKKHVEDFREKYGKKAKIEKNRWVAERPRNFIDVTSLVKSFLKSKSLIEQGVPKNLAPVFKQAKVIEHKELWNTVASDKQLSINIKKNLF